MIGVYIHLLTYSMHSIEGNDTAIILNDTNIGDLNDTLLNSIGINIREDCMKVPGSTVLYYP
jgi:hypothetical protein